MNKVVCGISISVDGFVAGAHQSFEKPFGDISAELLHSWMFDEPAKHKEELDALTNAGAFIMGSNMFGPKDRRLQEDWHGWWGKNPPFHTPVFVLSHKPRTSFSMEGGTTFNFVTDGIKSALKQAQKVAVNKPVVIAGGAEVVNQYLVAELIDELWLHIVPVTIGKGARLFENTPNLHMEPITISGTKLVTHIKYRIIK